MRRIFCFLLLTLASSAGAFDTKMLSAIDGHFGSQRDTLPLKIKEERLVFDYTGTFGQFLRSATPAATDNRYYKFQPAQRGYASILGYRFGLDVTQDFLKERDQSPRALSFVSNDQSSLHLRVLELSADGKAATTYQDCWQIAPTANGHATVQCALANKLICEQINKTGYNWDDHYRKAVEANRVAMDARLHRETLPTDINENRSMSLAQYELAKNFRSLTGELFDDIEPRAKSAVQALCKDLVWADESAHEPGTQH